MRIESAKPGVTDSRRAASHFSQEMFFEKNAEAERMVEWFNSNFKLKMRLEWREFAGRTMGQCYPRRQLIRLFVGGDSVATLLHEIAHQVDFSRRGKTDHSSNFHRVQDEMLDVFELNSHRMVLGGQPTLRFHVEQILREAAKAGREVDEATIDAYVIVARVADGWQVDGDQLLEAVIEAL